MTAACEADEAASFLLLGKVNRLAAVTRAVDSDPHSFSLLDQDPDQGGKNFYFVNLDQLNRS